MNTNFNTLFCGRVGMWLAVLVCRFSLGLSAATPAEEDQKREEDALRHPTFRRADVLVVDEDGKAVEGVKVQLFGIERFTRMPSDDQDFNPTFVWDFLTNPQGRFTVWFSKFKEHRYEELTGESRPGFGEFYLVASKEGYAGGVSRRIENWEQDESNMGWYETEWYSTHRPAVRLRDARSNPVKIVMRRGFTLRGRIVDTKGNPVPNVTLSVNHDLHVGTHTGYGGGFFGQQAVSDAQGRFQIQRIYPNRFYFFEEGTNCHWFKTRIGKEWHDVPVNTIDPPAAAREMQATIVLSRTPPFHHKGKVTDSRGRGIGGVGVVIGLSWHWPPRDFADNHHSERTETHGDGTFDLMSDAPFVQWVNLDTEGKARDYESVDSNDSLEIKSPLRNFHLIVRHRREESGASK